MYRCQGFSCCLTNPVFPQRLQNYLALKRKYWNIRMAPAAQICALGATTQLENTDPQELKEQNGIFISSWATTQPLESWQLSDVCTGVIGSVISAHFVLYAQSWESCSPSPDRSENGIAIPLLPALQRCPLGFLTRKGNVLPAKSFPGCRSVVSVSPSRSHGDVRDSPACSRETVWNQRLNFNSVPLTWCLTSN